MYDNREEKIRMTDKIHKKFEYFCDILDFISGVALAILTIVVLVEVVGRYFFNHPFTLTYDIALLLFPFIVMIAMVSVTFRNEHLGIVYFKDRMNRRIKKIIFPIIDILTILFIFFMFLSSVKLSLTVLYSKVGTWKMPQPFLYLPMVFSFGVVFLMILIKKLTGIIKVNLEKEMEK
jgi:TRAP-type transport system small permease protein